MPLAPFGPENVKPCVKCGAQDRYASSGQCKPCKRAYRRAYRLTHGPRNHPPEYLKAWRRANPEKTQNARMRHRYGITEADYQRMHVAQAGLCLICDKPETSENPPGRLRRLSVDHDHETGQIRGLLCHSCNRILGNANDDPAWLRRALTYLEESA